MIGVIMACVLVVVAFILYSLSTFDLVELVFLMSFTLPIIVYAKNNAHIWGCYFFVQAVTLVSRVPICTAVAAKIHTTYEPITIHNQVFLQIAGLTMIIGWFIWLLCTGVIVMGTCRSKLDMCDNVDELKGDMTIYRANCILGLTATLIVVQLVLSLAAYSLINFSENIVIFIVLAIVVAIGIYKHEVNIINEKRQLV